MAMSQDSCIIVKKRCPRVSTGWSLIDSWKSIGHHVASRFGGPEFLPVPYLLDANAYGIGHVFVPVTSEVSCCRSGSRFKLIGPIGKFLDESSKNSFEHNFSTVKEIPEQPTLKVKIGDANREISFLAVNYYRLSQSKNISAMKNLAIDRSSHEDLINARWIGVIREVVASEIFQLEITVENSNRIFYVGDNGAHTFSFRYEICKLDEAGNINQSTRDTRRLKSTKWLPLDKLERDNLPLSSLN